MKRAGLIDSGLCQNNCPSRSALGHRTIILITRERYLCHEGNRISRSYSDRFDWPAGSEVGSGGSVVTSDAPCRCSRSRYDHLVVD